MFSILLVFLVLGIPAATISSFWAGIRVFRHNRPLAGFILVAAVASALTFLWEMRFDIDLISNLLGREGLFMFEDIDTDMIFLTLYVLLFLAVLFARVRWKPEYGSALALNLTLVFWLLAGLPFLVLSPGMFAP
jgi:hypothetical protein